MAKIIHAYTDQGGKLVKVLTLNEPGTRGLVVRFTDLMSAALMLGYLFKGRCRCGLRILSDEERAAYLAERGAIEAGAGI